MEVAHSIISFFVGFNNNKLLFTIYTGAFGSVFRGKYTPNPEENMELSVDVAVKTIKSNDLKPSNSLLFLTRPSDKVLIPFIGLI